MKLITPIRLSCCAIISLRVTERNVNVDSLLHCAPCALHSDLSVVRDPTTGMLRDFTEVCHKQTLFQILAIFLFNQFLNNSLCIFHPQLMNFWSCLDHTAGFAGKHQPVCEEFTLITTATRSSSGEPSGK